VRKCLWLVVASTLSLVLCELLVAGQPTLASQGVNIFVKQALEDLLERRALPDGNLLLNSTRIAVRSDLPRSAMRLGSEALPERPGLNFYLLSPAAAQLEANRSKQSVYLITVDSPKLVQDSATLSVGIDLVVPSDPKVAVMCCCTGHGEFRRVDGRWRFTQWLSMICA